MSHIDIRPQLLPMQTLTWAYVQSFTLCDLVYNKSWLPEAQVISIGTAATDGYSVLISTEPVHVGKNTLMPCPNTAMEPSIACNYPEKIHLFAGQSEQGCIMHALLQWHSLRMQCYTSAIHKSWHFDTHQSTEMLTQQIALAITTRLSWWRHIH